MLGIHKLNTKSDTIRSESVGSVCMCIDLLYHNNCYAFMLNVVNKEKNSNCDPLHFHYKIVMENLQYNI